MLNAAGRILVVAIALLMAVATSGCVAFRIGLEWMTVTQRGQDPFTGAIDTVFQFLMAIFALQSLAFIPLLAALGVVITGEVARIRSVLFYVGGGGLAAAAIPLLIKGSALNWQIFATAGFAGGAVYWLIAGRRA